MDDRPRLQAAAFAGWLLASAVIVNYGLFRLPWHGWGIVAEDVGGYVLLIAPILIWSPGTVRTLALPALQVLAGAVLVAAAIAYAALGQHSTATDVLQVTVISVSAGLGEELAFRGYLWGRLQAAGLPSGWLVAVNVLIFTAWHLVSVAAGFSQLSSLIGVAGFGLIFSLARLRSGNTGLPALLHIAADIAGI